VELSMKEIMHLLKSPRRRKAPENVSFPNHSLTPSSR